MAPSPSLPSTPCRSSARSTRTAAASDPSGPTGSEANGSGNGATPSPPALALSRRLARTSPLVGGSLAQRKTASNGRNKGVATLFSGDGNDDDDDDKGSSTSPPRPSPSRDNMARSVHSRSASPSPPSSPPPAASAGGAAIIPTSLLSSLSPSELALAPPAVLIALVETQQVELIKAQGRVKELEENANEGKEGGGGGEREREKGEREREREREAWRLRYEEVVGEQARMEEELAGRVEVLDKLRTTVRDLERERKEATKRYREQAETFESERQAWYDQEQHYKLRISNLSQQTRRTSSSAPRAPQGGNNRRQSAPLPALSDAEEAEEADREDGEEQEEGEEEGEPKTPRGTYRAISPTPSNTSSSFESGTSSSANPPTSHTQQPSATELALTAQLHSLTTAHSSLSLSLRTLQTEMADLKRVYQDLQEENESYEILLGEKTLSGEVIGTDLFRRSFQWGESGGGGGQAGQGGEGQGWNKAFGFEGGLEAVGEEGEDGLAADFFSDGEDSSASDGDSSVSDSDTDDDAEGEGVEKRKLTDKEIERVLLESTGTGSLDSGAIGTSEQQRRRSRRTDSLAIANGTRDIAAALSPGGGAGAGGGQKKRGSSLGVSGAVSTVGGGGGGGLDLAAELELAQDAEDMDEVEVERQRVREEEKAKKRAERERKREERRKEKERARQSKGAGRRESSYAGMGEVDLLAELKQLREANKALTLYVSKIVDRVCSQEGFEKVLAVDYREKTPKTGPAASPPLSRSSASADAAPIPASTSTKLEQTSPAKKARPASALFRTSLGGESPSSAASSAQPSTPTASTSFAASLSSSTSSNPNSTNAPRKSGGLSWDAVSSVFGFGGSSTTTTPQSSNMKPLMLSAESSARKLDPAEEIDEDEDDRRERERIRAEMLQLGFEPGPPRLADPTASARPPLVTRLSHSFSASLSGSPHDSLSRSLSSSSIASSSASASRAPSSPRTLERERLATLARLEAQEAVAKAELKEGRSSGFTEAPVKRFSGRLERRHSSLSYRASGGGQ